MLVAEQIEKRLRNRIREIRPDRGGKLPDERVLAKQLGVCRQTVRKALGNLKREGLVRSIRGKGTFVSPAPKTQGRVEVVFGSQWRSYEVVGATILEALLRERGNAPHLLMTVDPVRELLARSQTNDEIQKAIFIGNYTRESLQTLLCNGGPRIACIGDLDETVRSPAICDNVLPDNHALAYRATDYLLRQGHRKIALLEWGLERAYGRDIIRGYTEALETQGLSYRPEYVLDCPPVPLGRFYSTEAILPAGDAMLRTINEWFQRGDLPTALIHYSATELQIREMRHHLFRDHFASDAVLAVSYREILEREYTGLEDAIAVCVKFESLARRAIELLLRPRAEGAPPVREFQEEIYVCHRRDGIWREDTL